MREQRDRLQRLAEPHLVAEDRACRSARGGRRASRATRREPVVAQLARDRVGLHVHAPPRRQRRGRRPRGRRRAGGAARAAGTKGATSGACSAKNARARSPAAASAARSTSFCASRRSALSAIGTALRGAAGARGAALARARAPRRPRRRTRRAADDFVVVLAQRRTRRRARRAAAAALGRARAQLRPAGARAGAAARRGRRPRARATAGGSDWSSSNISRSSSSPASGPSSKPTCHSAARPRLVRVVRLVRVEPAADRAVREADERARAVENRAPNRAAEVRGAPTCALVASRARCRRGQSRRARSSTGTPGPRAAPARSPSNAAHAPVASKAARASASMRRARRLAPARRAPVASNAARADSTLWRAAFASDGFFAGLCGARGASDAGPRLLRARAGRADAARGLPPSAERRPFPAPRTRRRVQLERSFLGGARASRATTEKDIARSHERPQSAQLRSDSLDFGREQPAFFVPCCAPSTFHDRPERCPMPRAREAPWSSSPALVPRSTMSTIKRHDTLASEMIFEEEIKTDARAPALRRGRRRASAARDSARPKPRSPSRWARALVRSAPRRVPACAAPSVRVSRVGRARAPRRARTATRTEADDVPLPLCLSVFDTFCSLRLSEGRRAVAPCHITTIQTHPVFVFLISEVCSFKETAAAALWSRCPEHPAHVSTHEPRARAHPGRREER